MVRDALTWPGTDKPTSRTGSAALWRACGGGPGGPSTSEAAAVAASVRGPRADDRAGRRAAGRAPADGSSQVGGGKTWLNERGRVIPIRIEDELKVSYLDYAMSVIVSRALPDVRDGLKPVHRRILYTMHEMGLTSNSSYRKCAAIVGEVMGKYHPHGDVALYDALVRLAQTFSLRYPLIDGQGNFGSVDGDPPAAMRYTEARMTAIAAELLADIDKQTVDFVENYDGTRMQPSVLPAKLPNLLVNGSSGIAVGMATNIPPHHLGEIADATIALIDDPELTSDELCNVRPRPRLPDRRARSSGATRGATRSPARWEEFDAIREMYAHGRGRIVMQAEVSFEETRQERTAIVVTELPFQVNKATLAEKIADLVQAQEDRGHRRPARRVGPRRHAPRDRVQEGRGATEGAQQPLQAHAR